MKIRRDIYIIGSIFLLSCGNSQNTQECLSDSVLAIDSMTEGINKIDVDENCPNSYELFAKHVLKDKIRKHDFELTNMSKVRFLKIFEIDGLEHITAFSNMGYPKSIEPNYYEHFTLFIATYKNERQAESSYEQIKSYIKYRRHNKEKLHPDLEDKVRIMTIGAKPGGMITQKGKLIFSLVETCGNTPIGGSWIDYEELFLEFVAKDVEEIEVLNSDCGMFNYKIENRKARR